MLCCVCCRCKRWLINCRRADLDGIFKNDPEYLYRNARLCSAHFEDSQFVNFAIKTRLRPDAVPTLFSVRNTPPLVGSHRRGPIRRINFQQKRDATNNDSHGNSSTAGTSDQSTVMMNETTDQAHLTNQHRPLLPSQSIIGKMLCTFVISSVHSRCHTTVHACKYDFSVHNKRVKWQYISDFYGRDSKQTVKLAPKLTDKHMNLPPFSAMRVCLVSQVFSHSVAAGINTHVAFGALPEEALATAEFIENVDGLFDCFNAGSLKNAKRYCRALTPSSSHWKHLEICIDIFSHLTVVNSKCDVPCINGFILTMQALKQLFQRLTEQHDFKFVLSNRLNQDCLENHFGTIRGRGGFRDYPDPHSFAHSFRQVLVKHVVCFPRCKLS